MKELKIVNRGGAERAATFVTWCGPNKGSGKSMCTIKTVGQVGVPSLVDVSVAHGWCKKPADDWRLTKESQDELLDFAEESGRKLQRVPKGTGRPRMPRKADRVHPKQQTLALFGLLLLFTACTPAQRERQVCYAVADAQFWQVVESCKERGLKYDECPELKEAELALDEGYGVCP